MKKIILFVLGISFLVFSCKNTTENQDNVNLNEKIYKVGVFDGHGGAETCIWEAYHAISIDPEMTPYYVTSSDITNGILDNLDALLIPGGGGSRQYLNLGKINEDKIKKFVADGNGIIGICAGAYLLSETPEYSCFAMNGAKAIDIEHDNRGHGICKFTLNEKGHELFPQLADRDTCYLMYYEGPVYVESDNDSIKYTVFATMESDVHEEGNAPKNMTNNKPFIIGNNYGKGKVISCIAHPEATPGMIWMIPAMVRWSINAEPINYKAEVVNPDIFNREILMSIEDLHKENSFFKVFLYGTADEKIEALDWLQNHHSWSAKRWIQGLLYDENASVRIRAAKYIADINYLQYLDDLKAIYNNELDVEVKDSIKVHLDKLSNLLP
ncbi:MAG: BPL-N domain-containing protein [Bacteroidales bacterium]|jgi:glutamine amidotransferase-like uncharacterized protein